MPSRVLLIDICPKTPKIVKGQIVDRKTAQVLEFSGEVPAWTTIKAGSVVEFTEAQIEELDKYNGLGKGNEHFNLEDVFPEMGILFGEKMPVCEILRAYSINTLEQVADDANGVTPFKSREDGTIPVHLILMKQGEPEQVKQWVAKCKEAIKES